MQVISPLRANAASHTGALANNVVHFVRLMRAAGVRAGTASTLNALALVEAAGIDAPYGCRTGVCHTCSTRLVSGCTTDVRDGRVSEAGTHVQLCVSTPLTDVALDL